jgi:hypothetical protein
MCGWCRDIEVGDPLPKTWDHEGGAAVDEDGCVVSPSCFTCPLPDCAYESGIPRVAYVRDQRILIELAKHQSLPTSAAVEKVAETLGITTRAVFRVLARKRRREAA